MIRVDIDNHYDDISFKLLTKEDIDDVKEVFEGGQDYFLKAEGAEYTEASIQSLFEDLPPNVPKENKGVLGFYMKDKPMAIVDLVKMENGKGFFLGLLLIHEDFREKGNGKQILAIIEQIVLKNDADYIRIGVLYNNIEAFIFWIRQGFICKKRTQSPMGEGQFVDVVALEKHLMQSEEERGFLIFRFNENLQNDVHALRVAARAIIVEKGKLLLVHSNDGSYQFPGGALDDDEIFEEAVQREVLEETGYETKKINQYLGAFLEKRLSRINLSQTYYLHNQYYLCEISEDKKEQLLEAYEKELGYQPVFIEIDEAIRVNKEIISKDTQYKDAIIRETIVLEWFKKQC